MVTGGFISPHVFQERLRARGIIVATKTVRGWCRRKKLDARKIGQAWKIREREVERIAEAGTA
jgi:transposase-like protein